MPYHELFEQKLSLWLYAMIGRDPTDYLCKPLPCHIDASYMLELPGIMPVI